MAKHLYNSRLGKIRWFIRRFGVREVFLKPLRVALAPWILPRLPRRTLEFQGQELPYFYHRYNMTWANERCVEVPLGRFYLQRFAGRPILEVGNVLSHYGPTQHTVLDKYERGHHILNQDRCPAGDLPRRCLDRHWAG